MPLSPCFLAKQTCAWHVLWLVPASRPPSLSSGNCHVLFVAAGCEAQRTALAAGVATTPANLESTSLLLAYGLDVFATRIQPSKAFDSLTDDFPYALLILITTFLLGAVVVLRFMDASATSKQKWF